MTEPKTRVVLKISLKNPSDRAWVATCDHGEWVWEIHRGTEHNARRSLNAHIRWEHEVA